MYLYLIATFAVTLLTSVLISDRAERGILSTAVLFLGAGFLAGHGVLNWIDIPAEDTMVSAFAEMALFSVLFTDGMQVGLRDLRSSWRLPGRALLLGMPLVLAGTAVLAHYVAALSWVYSLLLAAVLMPTDPVFASAIVGREEVPLRLRRLLNIESGVNDGLALPVVIIILTYLGVREPDLVALGKELLLGIGLGVSVSWVAIRLEENQLLKASPGYEPLHIFSIGLLLFALSKLLGANIFLAAFTAGITVASVSTEAREEFREFGELVTELLKLFALLLFGALISWSFLRDIQLRGFLFTFLAILLVRPIAVWIALLGSELNLREKLVAGWFGPKGFASVVYGLLVLKSRVDQGDHLFHLIAVVVAGSIIAHSSTDVLIAQWFRQAESAEEEEKVQAPNFPSGR